MQQKINLTQEIFLRMGKTTEAKPYQMNLRSPLLRINYYQLQAVTSKKNLSTHDQYQPTIELLPKYPIVLVL